MYLSIVTRIYMFHDDVRGERGVRSAGKNITREGQIVDRYSQTAWGRLLAANDVDCGHAET